MIDTKAIEEHIRGILVALGDDPDREGLRETPQRVAKMYEEVFAGMNYTNAEIAEMYSKTFQEADPDHHDLVLVRDIDVFSYCEHHMALMYDMKVSVGYLPRGKVIGLSKIARIADMAARRLQLQERLGRDCHSCMTARGIQKPGTRTITETYRGKFETDPVLQMRMEAMLK